MGFYSSGDNIEVAKFEEGPCPVCGSSDNTCKGKHGGKGKIQFISPRSLDDPLATFTVPERIYEETQVGSRTVKKLLYPKGAKIRPEEAKRLGLLPS